MKKTKWWRSKGATCTGMGSSVKQQRVSLNLYNVSGLFLILFSGLVFSTISVLVEFYVRSRNVSKAEIKDELRFALNMSNINEHRTRKERSKKAKAKETTVEE